MESVNNRIIFLFNNVQNLSKLQENTERNLFFCKKLFSLCRGKNSVISDSYTINTINGNTSFFASFFVLGYYICVTCGENKYIPPQALIKNLALQEWEWNYSLHLPPTKIFK